MRYVVRMTAILLMLCITGCSTLNDFSVEPQVPAEQEATSDFENMPNVEDMLKDEEMPFDSISKRHDITTDETMKIVREATAVSLVYKDLYVQTEKKPSDYVDAGMVISQSSKDLIEERLIEAGYQVIDSDNTYHEYLANSDGLSSFWKSVEKDEPVETTIFAVSTSGGLYCKTFQYVSGTGLCVSSSFIWNDDNEMEIEYLEAREILAWGTTYNGDFYYRDIYTDRHWDAASFIRLKPVDQELFELNKKYIMPIGYHSNNLFLCDWTSEDYGDLFFNDLFEFLYDMENDDYLNARDFPHTDEPYASCIPAALFESTILPYFDIPLTDFRDRTMYNTDEDIYPWEEITGSNILYFPSVEPEAIAFEKNEDGTMKVTVNAMCLDLDTSCLFTHEVTIRPSKDGGFKYVGNKIVGVSGHGFPPYEPRLP